MSGRAASRALIIPTNARRGVWFPAVASGPRLRQPDQADPHQLHVGLLRLQGLCRQRERPRIGALLDLRHGCLELGVELVDLTPELREHFGAPREVGVMVGRVEAGSPAARAGLEVADVVVRIGEEPVHDSWGFSGEVSTREGGETIALAVVRDGRERRIDATLERRERDAVDIGRWIFPPTPPPGLPPAAAAPRATPLPEMGPALERLGRLLESSDFQEQLKATQLRIDAEVEQRMKELEVLSLIHI